MKIERILKFICLILIVFVIINITMISPVLANNGSSLHVNIASGNVKVETKLSATILKTLFSVAKVLIMGYFAIRLTTEGIRYFIAVSADEKKAKKTRVERVLFYGALALFGIYIVPHLLGLG